MHFWFFHVLYIIYYVSLHYTHQYVLFPCVHASWEWWRHGQMPVPLMGRAEWQPSADEPSSPVDCPKKLSVVLGPTSEDWRLPSGWVACLGVEALDSVVNWSAPRHDAVIWRADVVGGGVLIWNGRETAVAVRMQNCLSTDTRGLQFRGTFSKKPGDASLSLLHFVFRVWVDVSPKTKTLKTNVFHFYISWNLRIPRGQEAGVSGSIRLAKNYKGNSDYILLSSQGCTFKVLNLKQ